MFISWIRHHGRSADLAEALGIEAVFLDGGSGNVLRRYLRQWNETRSLVRTRAPSSIIVMQPPIVALLAVLSVRQGRRAQLVGDLHTGALENPKWRWASGPMLRMLRKRGFAIVTNEALAEQVEARGTRVVVMHDLLPSLPEGLGDAPDDPTLAPVLGQGYILVPLAYANDEPVEALLEAAAAEPGITWVLTGKAPEAVRQGASPNIRFTGYVTNDDFQRLLRYSTAVAALTDREYTMQRAGYEALGAGRPLITASTRTLSGYFGDAVVYMDGTVDSIRSAARCAIDDSSGLADRTVALKAEKAGEERAALETLRGLLTTGTGPRRAEAASTT
ncbi:glycosyltransferase [Herbiconiux sp. VKM Ac-1786]|uniref:glycosyltransferase n=1 Tax=Herbiconiux sp. VKM Ac-1786 TaxID=2783824 RepID=UPI00188D3FD2|nr:glycosyltransferase [Herbiconiux sp. VKM Ac-1786]MBF4572943.1 glycosyltransferase [Herbiconiux sp. VKM Ac-1786]